MINKILHKLNIPIRVLIPYDCSFCFRKHKAFFTLYDRNRFFKGVGKCLKYKKKELVVTFLEHEYNQEIVEIEKKIYTLVFLNGEWTTARYGFKGHYLIDKDKKLAWKGNKSYEIKFLPL